MSLIIASVSVPPVYVPFKRPFRTSRRTNTGARNLIFQVEATSPTRSLSGVGEATPRQLVTRESVKEAEQVARYLAKKLEGFRFQVEDKNQAVSEVYELTQELRKLAKKRSKGNPFPSVTMGFEMAILDVVGQFFDVPMWQLLGEGDSMSISPNVFTFSAIAASTTQTRLNSKFSAAAQKYEFLRPKLTGNQMTDLETLDALVQAAAAVSPNANVWVDANERLGSEPEQFIESITDLMRRHKFSGKFIVEQPVPRDGFGALVAMQELAREKSGKESFTVSVMADESFNRWEDLESHPELLELDAFNIKAVKVGSLIESVRTAARIRAARPSALIYFGGVIGATDITGWATFHLHKASPGVSLCSATPRTNFTIQLAAVPVEYDASQAIVEPSLSGLGTFVDVDALEEANTKPVVLEAQPSREPNLKRKTSSVGSWLASRSQKSKLIEVRNEVALPGSELGISLATRVDELLPRDQSPNQFNGQHLDVLDKKELDSYLIETSVLRRGLSSSRFSPLMVIAETGTGGLAAAFHWSSGSSPSISARFLTGRKHVTKGVLKRVGVPVPRGSIFDMADYQDAVEYFSTLSPPPVVVKPSRGTGGVGVSTGISSESDLRQAWEKIWKSRKATERNDGFILVEEQLPGSDYRLCVVAGRVVSVMCKVPVHVRGDGKNSIRGLVQEKNTARLSNPHVGKRAIRLDAATAKMLEKQGLTVSSIPEQNQVILLRTANSFSQGADSVEVLDETHRSIVEAAEKAATAFPGLEQMGIDFILEDHTAPLESQRAGICEVKSSPAISSHHFPMYGPSRNVADHIVENELRLAGLETSRDANRFSGVEFTIRGRFTPKMVSREISQWCRELSLAATEMVSHEDSSTVSVSGDIEKVAVLSILLVKQPGVDTVTSRPL